LLNFNYFAREEKEGNTFGENMQILELGAWKRIYIINTKNNGTAGIRAGEEKIVCRHAGPMVSSGGKS
jgi:hypothetical protein